MAPDINEIADAWYQWGLGTDPLSTIVVAVLVSPEGRRVSNQSVHNRMRRAGLSPVKRGSTGSPSMWRRADVQHAYPALSATAKEES